MNPLDANRLHVTRREFFGRAASGIGTAALAGLLARDGLAAPTGAPAGQQRVGGLPGLPHFAPRAST